MKFSYTDDEMKVLASFALTNPNMIVYPDKFITINGPQASLIGLYNPEKAYEYEPFGIFDMAQFILLIKQFGQYQLENCGNYISIINAENGNEVKFNTTPIDAGMIKTIPDDKLESNYGEAGKQLQFKFTGENLATLKKVVSVLKSERLFFKTDDGKLKIIAADEVMENSINPFATQIHEENVTKNDMGDATYYIKMEELKILDGEYEVGMAMTERGGISFWKNTQFPVRYYIGIFNVK
jgi:hypothetical protein